MMGTQHMLDLPDVVFKKTFKQVQLRIVEPKYPNKRIQCTIYNSSKVKILTYQN